MRLSCDACYYDDPSIPFLSSLTRMTYGAVRSLKHSRFGSTSYVTPIRVSMPPSLPMVKQP